ncbi:hypothetical protein [Ureibacillus sinduriensis]|uniref:Uncharacterized protein n=1 Tax=Ureibacillus sinduriensis BLB-1 = JCM 15800 TaxID=1384057 RepID=A0A0A3IJN7_9BACL|nr:hypothetical protein [Ureibacillus sinduriensis]KGR75087.1 hypothetical protein CD33_12485 [Ureibacillus sinduriensis BLB-1 = JCM 15800]
MERLLHILNLPDLQFSQYCHHQFSINKGIYNTIDSWFFNNGITNILDRRMRVLQFMALTISKETDVKFGPGGLSKKLEDFWNLKGESVYGSGRNIEWK